MNLHAEPFNTQPDEDDATPECWVVVGRHRMTVAGKVREIQRQIQRSAQLTRDREAEDGMDDHLEEDEIAEDEAEEDDQARNLDPRLAGTHDEEVSAATKEPEIDAEPTSAKHNMQDGTPVGSNILEDQEPVSEPAEPDESDNHEHQDARPVTEEDNPSQQEDAHQDDGLPRRQDLKPATEPPNNHEPLESAEMKQLREEPFEDRDAHPNNSPNADDDRTANWVTKHSAPYRSPSPESLDPTGKWLITSEGITEKYGQDTPLSLTLYVTPTRPQSDNDTDDGTPFDQHNLNDDDEILDSDLLPSNLFSPKTSDSNTPVKLSPSSSNFTHCVTLSASTSISESVVSRPRHLY